MSSAKLTSDNIFWLLLLWPRSKWMTPEVRGAKKSPWNILYQILLAIHISTWINFKRTYQLNNLLSSYWMSSPPLSFLYTFATAFQNVTSVTDKDAASRIAGPSLRSPGGKSGTRINQGEQLLLPTPTPNAQKSAKGVLSCRSQIYQQMK